MDENLVQSDKTDTSDIDNSDGIVMETGFDSTTSDKQTKDNTNSIEKEFQQLIGSLTNLDNGLDELFIDINNDEDFSLTNCDILSSKASTSFVENKLHLETACTKNDYDKEIILLRASLELMLGDKYEMYDKVMQSWFSDKIDKDEFEKQITEYLTDDALLQLHNNFIMAMLKKSFQKCDNSSVSNFDHFTFENVLDENFGKSEKTKPKLDSKSDSNPVTESIVKKVENNEDDDETIVVTKKNRNRRRSRLKLSAIDDDDEDYLVEDTNEKTFNLKKKKRRRMVITSDDEDGGEGEGGGGALIPVDDTPASSNSKDNSLNDNSIDIKSSGLLKTTLTIKRNSFDTTTTAINTPNSSLLDQLLSSDVPISLLPQSSSESVNHSEPKMKTQSINISKPSTSAITTTTNNNNKSQLLKQCLANSPSPTTSKKLNTNSSLLSNCTTVSALASPMIQSQLNCSPPTFLPPPPPPPLSSTIHSGTILLNNKNVTTNNDQNQQSTSSSSIITPNSKIVELLNRKPNTIPQHTNSIIASPKNTKLWLEMISAANRRRQIKQQQSLSPKIRTFNKILDNRKPTKTNQSINNTNHHSTETNNRNMSIKKNIAINGFIQRNQFDSRSVRSFEKFDPSINGYRDDELKPNKTNKKNHHQDQVIHSDSIEVRTMSPHESIVKLKSCYDEVTLPDSIRLGLRISEYASQNGLKFVDKRVTYVCNIALRNFMKNILTELSTSRSSFVLSRPNGIQHRIGNPSINPYLTNSYKTLQQSVNCSNVPYSYSHNLIDGAGMVLLNLKPRSNTFGLEKNQLHFSLEESGRFVVEESRDPKSKQSQFCVGKFRSTSGSFVQVDNNKIRPTSCSLRHLHNILNTNRSLIPVHSVWSKALYRTISAFNNVDDFNMIDNNNNK